MHVRAEIGWTQQSLSRIDLVNVSDPSDPHRYGLGLPDGSRGVFVVAPLAGVEWQLTDVHVR